MKRYFFHIAYAGTHYHGWQVQENAHSVQGALIDAFKSILGIENPAIMGCGRTDTGVHAKSFYFHMDLEQPLPFDLDQLVYKLNAVLPKDIVIYSATRLHDDAHARFDAVSRTYEYHMHTVKDPFSQNFSTFYSKNCDAQLMNIACQYLIGKRDFTSFSKLHTDTHTNICEVYEAYWEQVDDKLVFTISANRFLRNMVRAVVGTLLEVGEEKQPPEHIEKVLNAKDRSAAGASAPADGLFLSKIKYPYPLKA